MRLVVLACLAACTDGPTQPPTAPGNLAHEGAPCGGTFTWIDSDGEDDYLLVHHVDATQIPALEDDLVTIAKNATSIDYMIPDDPAWQNSCGSPRYTQHHTYVLHARNALGEALSNEVMTIVPGYDPGP